MKTAVTVIVVMFAAILLMSWLQSETGKGHRPEQTVTLGAGGALCGGEELDTSLAYRALQNNDMAGELGLEARGKVILLEAGTQVQGYYESSYHMTRVNVLSGSHLGADCWIPTAMLNRSESSHIIHQEYIPPAAR